VAAYAVVPRGQWILQWPGMVVLCGSQIHWTREVSEAIRTGGAQGLKQYEEKCTAQLNEVVNLVRKRSARLVNLQSTRGSFILIHSSEIQVERVTFLR
jgi:dynein heavy chain